MSDLWDEATKTIERELSRDLSPTIFMERVIDACARVRPSSEWDLFRELPYDADLEARADHLVRITSEEPPPSDLHALWFGMFNPIYDDQVTADMYVAGHAEVDTKDEVWMSAPPLYAPRSGYFHSKILDSIYKLANKSELENDAEYTMCLAYGIRLAKASASGYAGHVGRKIWVSVGFDSGDWIDLGWIGKGRTATTKERAAKYYYVRRSARARGGYMPEPVEPDRQLGYRVFDTTKEGGEIADWVEREYRLDDGPFADYLTADYLFFCSERLRSALDEAKGPNDRIQWLPAWVTDEAGERRRYWALHFPEPPTSVIDTERTVYAGGPGIILKAVLDARKARGRNIMRSPEGRPATLFVSHEARKAILQAGVEGLVFDPFPEGRIVNSEG